MSDPDVVAVVFMDWGRWIAKCPRPGCPNAEEYGPGLDGAQFWCRPGAKLEGCGFRCPAQWPAGMELIERLLMARPVRATRNWKPGEPLLNLLAENTLHGIQMDGPLPLTDETMLALTGGAG